MGRRWVWLLLALTLAAGTAACSAASRGTPSVPASSPVSVTPSAAASAVAARTGTLSGRVAVPLPNYQPSKVVSETAGGVQLSSIDSVSKVARFYENALKSRGWRITYSGKSAANTSIVAMRGITGVGISISRADPVGASIIVTKCQC
jgi:hypothetical protein